LYDRPQRDLGVAPVLGKNCAYGAFDFPGYLVGGQWGLAFARFGSCWLKLGLSASVKNFVPLWFVMAKKPSLGLRLFNDSPSRRTKYGYAMTVNQSNHAIAALGHQLKPYQLGPMGSMFAARSVAMNLPAPVTLTYL